MTTLKSITWNIYSRDIKITGILTVFNEFIELDEQPHVNNHIAQRAFTTTILCPPGYQLMSNIGKK